jgi:hypothetical protein
MEKKPVIYTRINDREYEELKKISHATDLSLAALGRYGIKMVLSHYKKGLTVEDTMLV